MVLQMISTATGIVINVGIGIDEDLVARFRVATNCQLLGHGAGGSEHGSFFAEDFRNARFQAQHGGIVAKDVVAYFGLRHPFAHGGCGLGDGVAAQVDGHGGWWQVDSLASYVNALA